MREVVARAVAVIRNSPELSDTDVYRKLVAERIERKTAARLVEFVPMVYARLILAKSGMVFSGKYRRALPDGKFSPEARFSNEPIWTEAMRFAQAEIDRGVTPPDLLALAGRSAEFQALNQLLNRGSKLENVGFDIPTFRWPEEGPEL